MLGELVQFANGAYGQVFSLSEELVDILVFSAQPVTVGETVTRTGQPLQITLSPQLLGATLTPLSTLTHSAQSAKDARQIDTAPRELCARQRITQPLISGVSLVDLVLPLARGQRQLIVGDRKTGKTAFALQLCGRQVALGAVVVYAVIGKLTSEIKKIQQAFEQLKITDSVALVATAADDPPSVIYQTPFVAMAIAEYLNSLGKDVVVVFDDLTTHAKYYREVALIGKRFPGRDSYPGDIFYTHARLLERGGCFTHPTRPEVGVSISCLPIGETSDADLTDFIVSNLISMTDGHLLFDSMVYAQGHRPAIHPGLSVTRVGKQTQTAVQREITHELTSFINHYQKTINLTHFGAELTGSTTKTLERGEALFALLDQSKHQTYDTAVMVVLAAAVLLDWFSANTPEQVASLRDALQHNYSTQKTVRQQLDAVVAQAKNLPELSATLTSNQQQLNQLWQPLK